MWSSTQNKSLNVVICTVICNVLLSSSDFLFFDLYLISFLPIKGLNVGSGKKLTLFRIQTNATEDPVTSLNTFVTHNTLDSLHSECFIIRSE